MDHSDDRDPSRRLSRPQQDLHPQLQYRSNQQLQQQQQQQLLRDQQQEQRWAMQQPVYGIPQQQQPQYLEQQQQHTYLHPYVQGSLRSGPSRTIPGQAVYHSTGDVSMAMGDVDMYQQQQMLFQQQQQQYQTPALPYASGIIQGQGAQPPGPTYTLRQLQQLQQQQQQSYYAGVGQPPQTQALPGPAIVLSGTGLGRGTGSISSQLVNPYNVPQHHPHHSIHPAITGQLPQGQMLHPVGVPVMVPPPYLQPRVGRLTSDRPVIKLSVSLIDTYKNINNVYYEDRDARRANRAREKQAVATAAAASQSAAQKPAATLSGSGEPGYAQQQPQSMIGAGGANNNGWDDENYDYIVTPGELFSGRYKIKERIGKGSFGQVVRAEDIDTKQEVAIKIIKSKKPFLLQAKTEIELLTHLCDKDQDDQHNIGKTAKLEYIQSTMIGFFSVNTKFFVSFSATSYSFYVPKSPMPSL
jgi:hypothetical protein